MHSTRTRLVLALIVSGFAFLIILAFGETSTTTPQADSGTVTSAPQLEHLKEGKQVKVGQGGLYP